MVKNFPTPKKMSGAEDKQNREKNGMSKGIKNKKKVQKMKFKSSTPTPVLGSHNYLFPFSCNLY
ncbi:hypothetical protein D929_00097 [Enterococcus faecalis 02-MB-P-10]|nr:hypothetical protein D929_00097 [Enterococcus faecalis 02-MB-P-10]